VKPGMGGNGGNEDDAVSAERSFCEDLGAQGPLLLPPA